MLKAKISWEKSIMILTMGKVYSPGAWVIKKKNFPIVIYFFPTLLISQKISATTTTTAITPTHTPALKIPSIAWQLLNEMAIINIKSSAVFKLNLSIIIDLSWFIFVCIS
jgi:hypothetical protein